MGILEVAADPDDKRAHRLKNLILISEGASLGSAHGAIVFGIKVDHNRTLAKVLTKIKAISVLVWEREIWCDLSDFHGSSFYLFGGRAK